MQPKHPELRLRLEGIEAAPGGSVTVRMTGAPGILMRARDMFKQELSGVDVALEARQQGGAVALRHHVPALRGAPEADSEKLTADAAVKMLELADRLVSLDLGLETVPLRLGQDRLIPGVELRMKPALGAPSAIYALAVSNAAMHRLDDADAAIQALGLSNISGGVHTDRPVSEAETHYASCDFSAPAPCAGEAEAAEQARRLTDGLADALRLPKGRQRS